MNREKNYDELSKIRALKLWDAGDINRIEIGTFEGLRLIHEKLFHDIPGYNAGTLREVNLSKDKNIDYPILNGIFYCIKRNSV